MRELKGKADFIILNYKNGKLTVNSLIYRLQMCNDISFFCWDFGSYYFINY